LAAEFEVINDQTQAELRSVRGEISPMHMIDDTIAVERDETLWLN
jgi:hypothetical protein